jgi:hypothetical protein
VVLRINHTDRAIPSEGLKRVIERDARGFHRVAAAPELPRQRPTDFAVGPSVGVVQADAADKRSRRALLDRPHAEAAQLPVSHQHRHLPPRTSRFSGPRSPRKRVTSGSADIAAYASVSSSRNGRRVRRSVSSVDIMGRLPFASRPTG